MKGRLIVLDHIEGREAAALMVDGRLSDLLIDADLPRPGTIYRAVADRPVKGQGGMFLKTPDGPAFLRQVKGLAPGQTLLVQVSGYAEPGKAIPVTQKILFKSRYAIVTPDAPGVNVSRSIRDDDLRDQLLEVAHDAIGTFSEAAEAGPKMGLILRSCCETAEAEDIEDDILAMLNTAHAVMGAQSGEAEMLHRGDGPHLLAWRDWVEPAEVATQEGSFEDHAVMDEIDAARGDFVSFSGTGGMYIEPTRALVAVDVNTGNDASLAAGVKANMTCARLLPQALRVRGLAGQITLDLAPIPKKDRRAFENALRSAFKADGIETALVGWTPLGHYELQRKRVRIPLGEVLG